MTLTGRTRYRTNWRGKVILQVGETRTRLTGMDDRVDYEYWRDARLEDISIISTPLSIPTPPGNE